MIQSRNNANEKYNLNILETWNVNYVPNKFTLADEKKRCLVSVN